MIIQTRDFGSVEIDTNQIITFKQAILGFDGLTKYILISNPDISNEFRWLQSTEDSDICFIVIDPSEVFADYNPDISPNCYLDLDLDEQDSIALWNIIVVAHDFKQSTVNLKSPIIVNLKNNVAIQTVLDEDFSIRTPLFNENSESGGV